MLSGRVETKPKQWRSHNPCERLKVGGYIDIRCFSSHPNYLFVIIVRSFIRHCCERRNRLLMIIQRKVSPCWSIKLLRFARRKTVACISMIVCICVSVSPLMNKEEQAKFYFSFG